MSTNTDFREIIRDSLATFQKTNFKKGIDRYGAAVGNIATNKLRSLILLCEAARDSITTNHFAARFAPGGNANADQKLIKNVIVSLLDSEKGCACSELEVHEFLAHFVLLDFDFLHLGATDSPMVVTQLQNCLASDQSEQAPLLWTTFRQMARDSAAKSGEFDRPLSSGSLRYSLGRAGGARGSLLLLSAGIDKRRHHAD